MSGRHFWARAFFDVTRTVYVQTPRIFRPSADIEMPPQRRPCHGALCPSTLMRADMLICAGIIAQPIEPQGNRIFLSPIMHGNYAGFARSAVAIVERFGERRVEVYPRRVGSAHRLPT
jgi:hypothetical protein